MKTLPNSPEREKQVDEMLAALRSRLISGHFYEVTIDFDVTNRSTSSDFRCLEQTGSFTLRAVVKEFDFGAGQRHYGNAPPPDEPIDPTEGFD